MSDGWDADGLGALEARTAEGAAALESLKAPAERAAAAIDDAFARAGGSLARSLGRAAADGKLSLDELAAALIGTLNAAYGARGGGGGGLEAALAAAVGGAFRGARAEGGPVVGGGAYLVGERGPEVFRPAGAGEVGPVGGALGGGPVNVTVQVHGGGAESLLRSEAQIAGALARAAALGLQRM